MEDREHRPFADEIETVRRMRDELRLQVHLGRAEAKERWERLEKDWQHLEAKLKLVRQGSRQDLAEIRNAARTLVDEIREGYRHLRSLM